LHIFSRTLQSQWYVYLIGSKTRPVHLESKWLSGVKVRGWGPEKNMPLALSRFVRMKG
jgi:hypothetical protein